jgi:acyl-CoA synthetase (NDP forming)
MGFEALAGLLDCYGIPFAAWRIAPDADGAVAAAAEIGGPVALKAIAPGLVHKTDAHAVALGLEGEAAVRATAEEMAASLASAGHEVEGFLVQRMVGDGVEMLVGIVNDPHFGPVVAVGAGGIQAELIKDVSVSLPPIADADARRMLAGLRTYPLLTGFRGSTPVDLDSLVDVLVRIGALVEAHPAVMEMDLNPLIAGPDGSLVVDARVRLEPPPPPAPWPAASRA